MNWRRFRYFLFTVFFLGLSLLLAFGLSRGANPGISEFAILGIIVLVLMHLMERPAGNEDEAAGIISFDDDD